MEEPLAKPKPVVITDGLIHIGVVVRTINELQAKSRSLFKLNTTDTTLQILANNQTNERTPIKKSEDLVALSPHQVLMVIPHPPWSAFKFSIEKICEMLRKSLQNLYFLTEEDIINLREMDVSKIVKSGNFTLEELKRLKKMADEHLWRDQELQDRLGFIELCKEEIEKSNLEKYVPPPIVTAEENEKASLILANTMKNVTKLYTIPMEDLNILAAMDLDKMVPLYGIMAKKVKENAIRLGEYFLVCKVSAVDLKIG